MEKLTAEEYRKLSAGSSSAKEESFDHCDTDGFLSQWAHGLHSSLYSRLAELAENNWMSEFPALFYSANNQRVPAKIIYVKDKFSYNGGMKSLWAIIDQKTGKFTGQFLPTGKNSRKQKSAGMYEGVELAPAYAKIDGTGYGLSGRAWVSVYRTDGGFPKELLQIDYQMQRDEVAQVFVVYCENRGLNKNPHGILVQNSRSKSGKDYVKIICGKPGVDIVIDVYGERFILVKISGYNITATPSFNSIESAVNYINYYLEG